MALRIIQNEEGAVMFDSVTGIPLPFVHQVKGLDLLEFLDWLPQHPASYPDYQLRDFYYRWIRHKQNGNKT